MTRIIVECAIIITMVLSLVAAFVIVGEYLGAILPIVAGVLYLVDLVIRVRERQEQEKGRKQ